MIRKNRLYFFSSSSLFYLNFFSLIFFNKKKLKERKRKKTFSIHSLISSFSLIKIFFKTFVKRK